LASARLRQASTSSAPIEIAINNIIVIDASALGAILFGEPDAEIVEQHISDSLLIAPDILDYEITNIAFKKWRKQEMPEPLLRAALAGRDAIIVKLLSVDFEAVFNLTIQTRLTAYDASYLWVARQYDAELVTLDKRLNAAFLSDIGR